MARPATLRCARVYAYYRFNDKYNISAELRETVARAAASTQFMRPRVIVAGNYRRA